MSHHTTITLAGQSITVDKRKYPLSGKRSRARIEGQHGFRRLVPSRGLCPCGSQQTYRECCR